MALSVAGSSVASGVELVQEIYTASPNQLYKLVFIGNGAFQLIAGVSNKAVEVPGSSLADGVVLTQNGVSNTALNQQFVFEFLKYEEPVVVKKGPVAKDIHVKAESGKATTFSTTDHVTAGDAALAWETLTITAQPAHGAMRVLSGGQMEYTSATGFAGNDTCRYTISDQNKAVSAQALIVITVAAKESSADRIAIATILSPNSTSGFRIPAFEQYNKVSLLVSSRNGQRVYAADNYANGAWTGRGLAFGIYYYVLTLRKGTEKQVVKGYVCLVY
jgi:hypothetical protein